MKPRDVYTPENGHGVVIAELSNAAEVQFDNGVRMTLFCDELWHSESATSWNTPSLDPGVVMVGRPHPRERAGYSTWEQIQAPPVQTQHFQLRPEGVE